MCFDVAIFSSIVLDALSLKTLFFRIIIFFIISLIMSNLLFYILYFTEFFFSDAIPSGMIHLLSSSVFHLFSLYFFLVVVFRFTLKPHLMFHLCFHLKFFPMYFMFSFLTYSSCSIDANTSFIFCRILVIVF